MTTDRDRSIERLLRQARSTDAPAPAADCPDAETLAALADDTLPAAARREVEGHVADCHHCQALTAAIARADAPVGTPAEAVDDVPAWRRRAFNWLVPAAAAATAVALWVLVPGQRTPEPVEPTSELQIAEAPPPALPAPSSEVITSEPLQIPVEERADSLARQRDANPVIGNAAPAAPPPAAAPPPSQEALKTETSATGNLQNSAAAARRSEAAAGARAPAPQERALDLQARAVANFEVVSPDPRTRWRVGPGPVVQYSADGGGTWTTQQTGAAVELTAGIAPTQDVAWLVGRGGIVLRTTDAGRQWQRVPFPQTVDLTGITASTALNAAVVLTDGRRFATDDGGMTWTLAR